MSNYALYYYFFKHHYISIQRPWRRRRGRVLSQSNNEPNIETFSGHGGGGRVLSQSNKESDIETSANEDGSNISDTPVSNPFSGDYKWPWLWRRGRGGRGRGKGKGKAITRQI